MPARVNEDRDACDVRRRIEQAVDRRIRAEQRRVPRGQKGGQRNAGAAQQRREVVAHEIATATLPTAYSEDQVPADDPRDEFTQRGVRIGVGAACLRESSTRVPRSRVPQARMRHPAG